MAFQNFSLNISQFHGLTSEILDFCSIRGNIASNLAHHLAFFGTSLGRYPHVEWRGAIYPAVNWVIVGGTSCGKGESLRLISKIYEFDKHSEYLLAPSRRVSLTSGKNTPKYIYDELAEYDEGESRFLTINEEFVGQLNCLRISTNKMTSVFINLSDGKKISEHYGKNRVTLPEIHYGSVGHITPQRLIDGLKPNLIDDGFANRILFMGVPTPEYSANPAPYSYDDLLALQGKIIASLKIGGERCRVDMEDNALNRYQEYNQAHYCEEMADKNLKYLMARFPQQCLKVALIISLTNQEEKISLESMDSALAVMQYSRGTLEELFSSTVVSTCVQDMKAFIEKKGEATKTEITLAYAKKYSRQEIDNALSELAEQNVITFKVSTGARGRRTTTYSMAERRAAA